MQQLSKYLLLAMVFLLPWQTRWIYAQATIGGEAFELGTMSLYVVEVLILATFMIHVVRQISHDRLKSAAQLFRTLCPFILFLLGLLSVIWAINGDLVIAHALHIFVTIVLFFTLFSTPIPTQRIVWAFALGLIVPTLLGIWQVATGSSPAFTWLGLAARDAQTLGDAVLMVEGERILRAYGSFPHPNIFGGYLAIGLLGIAWLWKGASVGSKRWLRFVGTILLGGLVLTFSRSAWIALALCIFVLVAEQLIKGVSGWRGWLAMARGVRLGGAIIILLVAFLTPLIVSRFSLDSPIESRSVTERIEQYQTFGHVFSQNWFAGVGLANYTLAIEQIDPTREWWEYQPVHNAWALLIGELGLIGLFVVIGGVLAMIRGCKTLPIGRVLHPLVIVLLPLFVISLFDHYLWSLWPGLALLAITIAVSIRIKQNI